MYYKEEIINGILCWKGTPNGEWIEFTKDQLTEIITKLKQQNAYLISQIVIEENDF